MHSGGICVAAVYGALMIFGCKDFSGINEQHHRFVPQQIGRWSRTDSVGWCASLHSWLCLSFGGRCPPRLGSAVLHFFCKVSIPCSSAQLAGNKQRVCDIKDVYIVCLQKSCPASCLQIAWSKVSEIDCPPPPLHMRTVILKEGKDVLFQEKGSLFCGPCSSSPEEKAAHTYIHSQPLLRHYSAQHFKPLHSSGVSSLPTPITLCSIPEIHYAHMP